MLGDFRPIRRLGAALALLLAVTLTGAPEARTKKAARKPSNTLKQISDEARVTIIQHAQVWTPTTVSEMDLRLGPQGEGAFQPNAAVSCDYVEEKLDGSSPKFDCRLDDGSVVKVKYGLGGEVQGEVLSTRLLWALGFGADRIYPAVVTCRGCSVDPWNKRRSVAETH